jgi:hypothetical protein
MFFGADTCVRASANMNRELIGCPAPGIKSEEAIEPPTGDRQTCLLGAGQKF